MAYLTYTGPLHSVARCELTKDQTEIGRMPTPEALARGVQPPDIALDDSPEVSRRHAAVIRKQDKFYLEDRGSRNHTYLNGKINSGRTPRLIQCGDTFVIGRYRFQFHDVLPDAESAVVYRTDFDDSDPMPSSSISLAQLSDFGDSNVAVKRLSVLIEMTTALQDALLTDDVLAKTLSGLFRVFPAIDRGLIGFIGDNDVFVPKWWKCRNPHAADQINVSQTIVRQVIATRQAMLFDGHNAPLPTADSVRAVPLNSVICAPLIDPSGCAFGILQVDSSQPRGFDPADLELVAAVAVQISLAIHMSRLHDQALQNQALERDLENAREVQRAFLPQSAPDVEGYGFAWFYEPARTIGGDYFDIVPLTGGRVAIVLADVAGKGIPAALYMARLATETRACLEWFEDPKDVIRRLNARLQTRLATFAMAVLEPATHTVTVVNAGHRTPTICRPDGTLATAGVNQVQVPFSVADDIVFEAATFPIATGESVVMFSDGFEDALNAETGTRFGIDRINDELRKPAQDANGITSALVRSVREFTGETPQFDDMCVVAFRRH